MIILKQVLKQKIKQKNKASCKGRKILTSKQTLQRLPTDLAQVQAGNNSENLLNEIGKLFIRCINQKKLPKKYITT